ncbi:MAG: hypothetical protein WBA01_03765 [Phormidesmis sp.]
MTGRQNSPKSRQLERQRLDHQQLERQQTVSPLQPSLLSPLSVRQPGGKLTKAGQPLLSKPLLHILGRDEQPGDMVTRPKQAALRGQTDVYIARAEIELRNAMQSLALMTQSEINSISTLTALSLPKAVAPMFWTINALLQEKFPKPNDAYRIHHRNHDSRLLFQQLARLNLRPWSQSTVDYLRPSALPHNLMFPIGHPVVGSTYRRHPFKSRSNHYYPVTDYFSILFKEREQALLALLGELGATKITMAPIPATSALDCQENLAAQLHHKIFEYPKRINRLPTSIDLKKHPWLAGEPSWQPIVRERLNRGALSAQFEFDCDVIGMLRTQVKMIAQLIPGLDSMALPDDYDDILTTQILHTRRVQVEFSEVV